VSNRPITFHQIGVVRSIARGLRASPRHRPKPYAGSARRGHRMRQVSGGCPPALVWPSHRLQHDSRADPASLSALLDVHYQPICSLLASCDSGLTAPGPVLRNETPAFGSPDARPTPLKRGRLGHQLGRGDCGDRPWAKWNGSKTRRTVTRPRPRLIGQSP
jgi:hypothetical protein